MQTKLYIGMDLHKNTSTFSIKDRDGAVIAAKKLHTEPSEISGFLKKFSGASLAVEPVSQWYFYADLIEKLGIEVHLAHPSRVKAIAAAKVKTDTIDVGVLCDLLRSNLLPEAYFSAPDVRYWKEMVRYRTSLIHLRTEIKNKIHAILFKHALSHPFTNLFGVSGRKWLEALQLPEPYAANLTSYLGLVDAFTQLAEEADRRIIRTVQNHPQARLLTSIPGLGYVSALTIIAEIGTIDRFPSAKKLQGTRAWRRPPMHPETSYATAESPSRAPAGSDGLWWKRPSGSFCVRANQDSDGTTRRSKSAKVHQPPL